jgi:CAAX protease family protein
VYLPRSQPDDRMDEMVGEGSVEPSAPSFPLNGVLERNGFGPGITIVTGLILGFIAFQGISLLTFMGVVAFQGDLGLLTSLAPTELVSRFAPELLSGNTVGQFLGLLLFGWVLARLHSSKPAAFLRLRRADWTLVGLSLLGIVALVPVVQWMGAVMDGLPWPDWIREVERTQVELIEEVLNQNLGLVFTLFAMAVTPAICEEVFFRGYIQRQSERLFSGWLSAVLFTGLIFGLYHLRLTQALPLSVLGAYMAYVVWRSDSLVPGILVHLANNGFAVLLGAYLASSESISAEELESMDVPIYIVIPAAVVFGLVIRALHRRGHQLQLESSLGQNH